VYLVWFMFRGTGRYQKTIGHEREPDWYRGIITRYVCLSLTPMDTDSVHVFGSLAPIKIPGGGLGAAAANPQRPPSANRKPKRAATHAISYPLPIALVVVMRDGSSKWNFVKAAQPPSDMPSQRAASR
jgi:hypothetical protein